MKTWLRAAILSTGVTLVVACAVTRLDLPPVTAAPTNQQLAGKIIWHDLLTHTPRESMRFYGELFGWEFDTSDDDYILIRHNGRPIGGMIDTKALNGRDDISQWVAVMSVGDVDAAAEYYAGAGGSVLTPPTELRRRGRLAVVVDTEGAPLALLQAKAGDPVDREPEVGDFLWDELWSHELAAASQFYAGLAGYDVEAVSTRNDGNDDYRILSGPDGPRAGIMAHPLEGLEPVWVSYLRVDDPSRITARVDALGGRVLVETKARAGGQAAMVAGPSGAGIALQTWPPHSEGDAT